MHQQQILVKDISCKIHATSSNDFTANSHATSQGSNQSSASTHATSNSNNSEAANNSKTKSNTETDTATAAVVAELSAKLRSKAVSDSNDSINCGAVSNAITNDNNNRVELKAATVTTCADGGRNRDTPTSMGKIRRLLEIEEMANFSHKLKLKSQE